MLVVLAGLDGSHGCAAPGPVRSSGVYQGPPPPGPGRLKWRRVWGGGGGGRVWGVVLRGGGGGRRPISPNPPPFLSALPGRGVRRGGCPGMHCKGGGNPPPPSRAPSLCPATVSLAASAGFNSICNRQ